MKTGKFLAIATLALLGAVPTAGAYCFEAQLNKGLVVSSIETQSANEAVTTKKFNLADAEGRNRGYVVLNSIRTVQVPNPMDPSTTTGMIDSLTSIATLPAMSSHDQNLSKAFEQGWKIVKIRNASRPIANQNCSGNMVFSDTIQVGDRAGFDFRR